ncbi:DsbE family thiol:disulfide interchange protein [uncultured Aureimonas sp.]|uniref:DsbE family thiol:disulfide interchange protein n=1 Tax=uncultured Aureimonas sp. TaxID=1604662 RepID=UPI0025F08939|nr:DsbE family thiol:disulfide interchange protein [uncultured Aureimonas sp.]
MSETAKRPRRRPLLVMLPVVLFAGLAGVFLYQLLSGHDPQVLPSALIGKPAPETRLPPLEGLTTASGAPAPGLDLVPGDGRVRLVNVFASWCVPCRQEHPALMALSQDPRFEVVAINYKDKPENALAFLSDLGNPFDALGTDEAGRSTIDWGVYGVPETFLVGPDGTILWKQTGPLTPQSVEGGLMPALAKIAPAGD